MQEALQYPSLNIRGLRSAYIGAEARTVIPESAIASIDIRLVKETDPDRMIRNNQHSENENLRLENLWKAIVTFADVLRM